MRARANWEYVNVVKEIMNFFKFRKRLIYMCSLDFSNVKAHGQEVNVTSERNIDLEESPFFQNTSTCHLIWVQGNLWQNSLR